MLRSVNYLVEGEAATHRDEEATHHQDEEVTTHQRHEKALTYHQDDMFHHRSPLVQLSGAIRRAGEQRFH
jgi:hypothetical protein